MSLKIWEVNGYLHEDLCTFMMISRPFLFRMRNVSDKRCIENHNTHFTWNNSPLSKSLAVYKIMWKNIKSQTCRRWQYKNGMRFACWIAKATDTHSEYVILIAFLRQQYFAEASQFLRCAYTAFIIYVLSYSFCAFFGQSVVIKWWHIALQVGMKFDIRIDTRSFWVN